MSCEEQKTENDPRPTNEIVAAILAEKDEDRKWDLIWTLHERGTREVFDAATQLTASENSDERSIGVDILDQLGGEKRSFPEETREVLLDLLAQETDPAVLHSILVALAHNPGDGTVERAVAFKDHPSESVRRGVVSVLLTQEDTTAVDTLIELSSDEDVDVRNWATFGLAQQTDTDTPELREALVRRLNDEDPDVRAEATVGLAKRGDQRVVEPLLDQLRDFQYDYDYWVSTILDAAREVGDARAYPLLVAVKESGLTDGWLDQAIAACRIPSLEEYEAPDGLTTTCPVCGLREAFSNPDEWQFCSRCGWVCDDDQRADPDLEHGCNRRSLNQERERWQRRLAH